jgi:hypothetical protein
MNKQKKHLSKTNHKKQVLWQVYLPMMVFIGIIVVLSILVAGGDSFGSSQNEKLAHISTLYLMSPVLIGGLPILAILISFIYLVSKIFPYVTHYGNLITEKIDLVHFYIKQGMDAASKPFIQLPAAFSGFHHMVSGLTTTVRRLFLHD